jgi:hypothetical protein
VQELANGLSSDSKLVRVDVDQNPEAAEAALIEEKPTYQFYKNGNKICEIIGLDLEAMT